MRYYSEDTVRKIIRSVAHTALEQMNSFADSALAHQPSIELPDKYGRLVDADHVAGVIRTKIDAVPCEKQGLYSIWNGAYRNGLIRAFSIVDDAPTVLEATE